MPYMVSSCLLHLTHLSWHLHAGVRRWEQHWQVMMNIRPTVAVTLDSALLKQKYLPESLSLSLACSLHPAVEQLYLISIQWGVFNLFSLLPMALNYDFQTMSLYIRSPLSISNSSQSLIQYPLESAAALSPLKGRKQKTIWTVFLPKPKGGPVGKTLLKSCQAKLTSLNPLWSSCWAQTIPAQRST